jgi:polyisoprenoid-binding protein YceI
MKGSDIMIGEQNLFCPGEVWSLCRKGIAALILASLLLVGAVRGTERFQIDPAHAFVTFTVSHFSGKAKGSFTDVSGLITFDEKDITKSSVEVVIKTASIHTGNQNRDQNCTWRRSVRNAVALEFRQGSECAV